MTENNPMYAIEAANESFSRAINPVSDMEITLTERLDAAKGAIVHIVTQASNMFGGSIENVASSLSIVENVLGKAIDTLESSDLNVDAKFVGEVRYAISTSTYDPSVFK